MADKKSQAKVYAEGKDSTERLGDIDVSSTKMITQGIIVLAERLLLPIPGSVRKVLQNRLRSETVMAGW